MTLPSTMQFIDHGQGGAPDVLRMATGPVPQPAPSELLVRVAYAGVNRPDCAQRVGSYPPPPGASPILGLEASGVVVAVGEAVDTWQVGDQVCGLCNGGAYAEYVSVPAGQALPIPKGLSLLQAAALPENFFTVWTNVFARGGLTAGESLLVHGGSSGIGLTAIQLAAAFGARVITTVGNQAKAQACLAAGASHAVLYKDEDFVQAALDFTGGQGVNAVLDMVGGDYMARNLNALAVEGRLIQVAFLQGANTQVNWLPLMTKRLHFTGSTLRPRSPQDKAAIAGDLLQHVWPLLETQRVSPVIYQTMDWTQAAEAHALMESSAHIGKIMLKVSG
ncbi:MAG: NAD(P)H-quinone oxidoreductase [Burkholderiaceae bacterium]